MLICGLYAYMFCLSQGKAKKKSFPECLGSGTQGRLFKIQNQQLSSPSARSQHSGKRLFFKKGISSPNVVLGEDGFFKKKYSPSVALGEEVFL
jgi:hypothetical protein